MQKSPAQETVREAQGAAARGSKKQRQNGVSRRGQCLILHLFSVAAMQPPRRPSPQQHQQRHQQRLRRMQRRPSPSMQRQPPPPRRLPHSVRCQA